MNEVGKDGKGESVWLAFFLYRVLMDYAETANVFGRQEDAREHRGARVGRRLVPARFLR